MRFAMEEGQNMTQPDRLDAAWHDDDAGAGLGPLGPPGWAEFSAARERFMRTVTVAGLETAWDAPALDPRSREWREGAP
jgi:hypothetical protein